MYLVADEDGDILLSGQGGGSRIEQQSSLPTIIILTITALTFIFIILSTLHYVVVARGKTLLPALRDPSDKRVWLEAVLRSRS